MFGFGQTVQLEFRCEVDVPCPSCEQSPLQLHWGRMHFAVCGIPTVNRGAGYFLKCRHCVHGTLYGPIEPDVAVELQEIATDTARELGGWSTRMPGKLTASAHRA